AERTLRDFLVMQFLKENHLGDEFPGVVTGVVSAGVFVSIERFLVEGMVKMSDVSAPDGRPDRWKVDEATGRLQGHRSGASLGIGDIVTVQIINVDLASRHLDLLLTDLPPRSVAEAPVPRKRGGAGSKAKGKRKGYKKGRRGRRSG
ncbi:MAG: S1 RNA-binding domain-containing protein, partial [Planctomycetota bacterium]|nr:S1 RNA-binding domain-containing protein [Planctomycetota bacterium]